MLTNAFLQLKLLIFSRVLIQYMVTNTVLNFSHHASHAASDISLAEVAIPSTNERMSIDRLEIRKERGCKYIRFCSSEIWATELFLTPRAIQSLTERLGVRRSGTFLSSVTDFAIILSKGEEFGIDKYILHIDNAEYFLQCFSRNKIVVQYLLRQAALEKILVK